MMPTLSTLVAPDVVVTTSSNFTRIDKIDFMATDGKSWLSVVVRLKNGVTLAAYRQNALGIQFIAPQEM